MRSWIVMVMAACQTQVVSEAPVRSQTRNLVALDPDVIAERLAKGRLAETELGEGIEPATLDAAPAYFLPYAALVARMQALAEAFPDTVELIELAPSGEGTRSVWMLRLHDKAQPVEAKALVYAGEHSREIANPAMLLRWAEERVSQASWLLKANQVDVIPLLNPDGHAVVERGFAEEENGDTWQRKTTSAPDGTDPNRNYPFRWGLIGASDYPYSDVYRGPSAGSEVEVQTLRALSERERYAVAIDFHSYAKLNLYPWGDIYDPSPDDALFKAIGHRYLRLNGYSSIQSAEMYPTSGNTADGIYGEHGVYAMVIETGDEFHQSQEAYEETCALNLPVIDFTVALARDPQQAHGAYVHAGVAQDAVAVEWRETREGPPTPVAAADGAFDSDTESLGATPAGGYLRAKSASGQWGPFTAR